VAETLALAVEQFAAPKRPKPKAAKPPEAKSGRGLSARIAAHESWAATADRSARTANARSRFDQRFLDQVDPERVLSERERAIRAEHARKAYFLEMARKSAESRRKKAATP
jgi:hypothetical protein